MKELYVRISNWEKYNARKDVKNSSWLKLQHDFFTNPHFHNFSPEERLAWVWMMCERSRLKEQTFHQYSHQGFHRWTGLDPSVLVSCISKLVKERIVEVRTSRGRHVSVTQTSPTLHKITKEENPKPHSLRSLVVGSDLKNFEEAYNLYPRKIGRTPSLKKYSALIKGPDLHASLLVAIKNFIAQMELEKRDETKIPYFSTFLSSWQDWINFVPTKTQNEKIMTFQEVQAQLGVHQ